MAPVVGMRFAPSVAMTPLLDTRETPVHSSQTAGSGGAATVFAQHQLEPGPFSRRCPDCGRIDHSDSELAGMCEYCPGLVPLQAA
jgi:hypothetical protein